MFPCAGDEAFPWRMMAEPFSVAIMIELSSQQNLLDAELPPNLPPPPLRVG
jgi:hypothetical protein